MSRFLLSSLVILLSSLTSFAAIDEAEQVMVLKSTQSARMAFQGSSEYNRIQKNYSLYLETTSGTFYGGGLGVAYFLNHNAQILVDSYGYTSSAFDQVFDWVSGVHDKVQGSSFGIHYKQFVGNSFFIRGGLDQRRILMERTFTGGVFRYNSPERISYFEGTATNVVLGVGNDWQWRNFTLGADWFRFYLPVASKITRQENAEGKDQNSLQDYQDKYLNKSSVMIGFHLGASF